MYVFPFHTVLASTSKAAVATAVNIPYYEDHSRKPRGLLSRDASEKLAAPPLQAIVIDGY